MRLSHYLAVLATNQDANGWARLAHRRLNDAAPSIYEMDNVKKGILCQLFGGTNKTTSEERFRCDCGPVPAGGLAVRF